MERSHRSYRVNESNKAYIFGNFHRNAYSVANTKQTRLTLGQRFANLMNPIKSTLRKAVD